MNDLTVSAIVWSGLVVHMVVGVVALRGAARPQLVPLVNLLAAACILSYWATRWFGYLFRGLTWYATDQLIPLYAVLVCILAGLSLGGRYPGTTLNWLVFAAHTIALAVAALFFATFRLTRLF